MLEVLAALAPSLFVGLLFWWVIRAMLQGDRRERAALARLDQEEAERRHPGTVADREGDSGDALSDQPVPADRDEQASRRTRPGAPDVTS